MIIDPFQRRRIASNLVVVTDLSQANDIIEQARSDAYQVETAVTTFLNGQCSLWEMLELVENCDSFNIDQYAEEILENLEEEFGAE